MKISYRVVAILICFVLISALIMFALSKKITLRHDVDNMLVVPLKNLPITTDPHEMADIFSMFLSFQIHRGLTRYTSSLEVQFDLAKEVKSSVNELNYTIILRPAKFSDGQSVTANHVVNTFRRLFLKKAGMATDMQYIKGAAELIRGNRQSDFGVKAINDSTVTFELTKRSPLFLKHLALPDCSILPLKEDLNYVDWKSSGAGAFKIKQKLNNEILLGRANGENKPGSVRYLRLILLSESDVFSFAEKGTIDSVDGYWLVPEQIEKLKAVGWKESVSAITKMLYLSINPQKVSLGERAFLYKILVGRNFDELGKSFVPLFGLIPPIISGALDSAYLLSHQVIVPKTIDITILDDRTSKKIAEIIKRRLKKEGVRVNLNVLDTNNYIEAFQTGDFEAMVVSKFLDYPDGLSILTFFQSDSPYKGFFPKVMKIDALMENLQNLTLQEERASQYKLIQRAILEKAVIIPLVTGNDNASLWGPKVKVIPAHPMGIHTLVVDEIKLRE